MTGLLIVYFAALFISLAITSVYLLFWLPFLVFDAYYSEQSPENDQSPFGSELGSEMDSEDAYDLREVSSDVEMHPDDLDGVESDAR